jgi:hypothetical protein
LLNFGDVPTWLAAIGTVGALLAALFQIRNERRHRHAVEERERQDRHLAQARLVSALLGPQEVHPDRPSGGRTAIQLINGSDEPVYGLVLCVVYIQGAAPQSLEDMLAMHERDETWWPPITTVSILPSNVWRVWIDRANFGILSGRLGIDVAFTDRAGAHWIRRATGGLEELAQEPLEYIKRWKMFGPHDLQIPERSP